MASVCDQSINAIISTHNKYLVNRLFGTFTLLGKWRKWLMQLRTKVKVWSNQKARE